MIEIENIIVEVNKTYRQESCIIAIVTGTMKLGAVFGTGGQRTIEFGTGTYAWVVQKGQISRGEYDVEVLPIAYHDTLEYHDIRRIEHYIERCLEKIPWDVYMKEFDI